MQRCAFLRTAVAFGSALVLSLIHSQVSIEAQELKRFEVPGHQEQIDALNAIQAEFGNSFTNCALWDAWIPYSTIWTSHEQARRYRDVYLTRPIDEEGYVSMLQHRGMAHSEGWPFPAWQQSTGRGWHFSTNGEGWAVQNFNLQPLTNTEGWSIEGAKVKTIDPERGLILEATGGNLSIATPEFACGTVVAPFVRLEWAIEDGRDERNCQVSWLVDDKQEFSTEHTANYADRGQNKEMHFANVPMYRYLGYAGMLKRIQVSLDCKPGTTVSLKSIITASDTRHPITNSMFIVGSAEYFLWTGDVEFLQKNILRMRKALSYAMREFKVEELKHVYVPWVGHDGRTGLIVDDEGKTTMRPGLGVGNNYWDLLPFGGHDALATMYMYQAMLKMASIESAIDRHPGWLIDPKREYDPHRLDYLAKEVKQDFQNRFWNDQTQRFVGWVDSEGKAHDYGFTFVNLEAIHYGLASEDQAKAIFSWLDGRRAIDQDTSQGTDIYHWRFAPRATTKRNVETYVWAWNNPAAIPWGGQVQDGGAVLGFSFYDLSSRLQVIGPDDAWKRLREIAAWKKDVDAAGGYRAYYAAQPGVTLQGCGTAGGLGIDCEFFESVLVPQIMLRGFLGFEPTAEGCKLSPKIPPEWTSLTVRDIHLHGYILHCTVHANGRAEVMVAKQGSEDLVIELQGIEKTLRLGDEKLQWN